jgi:hypothetical protein
MRFPVLPVAVAVLLAAAPAGAQEGQPSSATDVPSAGLPVSLDRIRLNIEQTPAEPLKGLHDQPPLTKELPPSDSAQPTFKVEVQEQQKFRDLVKRLDFSSGPVPPGGLYAYEQMQLTTPKIYQPYAVFNQRELLVIALENLLEKYLFGQVAQSVTDAAKARAEQAAREEVDREMAEFLAEHPESAASPAR